LKGKRPPLKAKGTRQISKGKKAALSLFSEAVAQPSEFTFAFCLLPFTF
jgi:hypothetical protein